MSSRLLGWINCGLAGRFVARACRWPSRGLEGRLIRGPHSRTQCRFPGRLLRWMRARLIGRFMAGMHGRNGKGLF